MLPADQRLIGFDINFLINPESELYKENRAYVRLYDANGSLLGSHEVTWECKCKDCGAASGASSAGMGSVKYSMPITSIRNGLTPIAFGYDSALLSNQGRGNLVLNGPQGTSADGAVTVVNSTSNPTWIDSVTAGNIVANVTSAATANDPLRFIVTVSSDKLNPSISIFRTLVFENTTAAGSPAFKVTETLFGKITESIYQTPSAGTWQLTTGNGLRRLTEFTDTASVVGQETKRTTLEQRSDTTATFEAISDTRNVRKKFSWGWETIQEITDPDGLALTTQWDYYEGAATNTAPPGSSVSNAGLGRIKSMNRYDGANELHYYSAPIVSSIYQRIHETLRPFAGTAALQRTVESEGLDPITNLQSMLTEVFIGSTQVSKTTTQRAILTGVATTRSYTDATSYLETVSTQDPNSTARYENLPNSTRTEFIESPDGTLLRQIRREGVFTTVPPSTALVQVAGTFRDESLNELGYVIAAKTLEYISTTAGYPTDESYATTVDTFGRPLVMGHFPNAGGGFAFTTEMEYGCCGLVRERDKYGVDTYYAYDSLRRRVKTNRLGVTTEMVYAGRTSRMHRYPENVTGSLLPLSQATASNEISRTVSNIVGDVTETWARAAADGSLLKTMVTTAYAPAAGLSKRVTTQPPTAIDDGAAVPIRIQESYLDGQLYQEAGNLAPSMRYGYGANATGFFITKFYLDGANLCETRTTQWDWLNREVKMTYASDENADTILDYSATFYNSLGQLSRTVDPDGVTTLYGYNPLGQQTTVATDLNSNNTIDLAADRVSFSETRANYNGFPGKLAYVERTNQSVRIDDGGSPIELATLQQDSTYDGLRSWSARFPGRLGIPTTQFGAETSSLTTLFSPGNWSVRTTAPDSTYSVVTYTAGRLVTRVHYDKSNKILYTLSYSYADPLFRLKSQTDSRTGTTTYSYVSDNVDVVSSVTDSIGRITSHAFDARDRKISMDLPDTLDAAGATLTNITISHYFPDGTLQETTGAQTYRSTSSYDYAQRLATLTTYGSTTAMTRWEYDSNRGLLRNKRYDSSGPGIGSGPSYTYTAAGRVKFRTWARLVASQPLVTSYTYAATTGELASTTYSDGTPSVIISARDRLGRITAMTDAAGTHTYSHKLTGPMLRDAITGSGPLEGCTLTHTPDNLNRPAAADLALSGSSQHAVSYGYDAAGRLGSIAHQGRAVKYGYHPTRQTLALTTMIGTTGQANLQHERIHDNAGRLLTTISHLNATANAANYQPAHLSKYTLNALDQRIAATELEDRSWSYGYNSTGEVTKAAKTITSSGSSLAGRNFRYAFDGIGNRTSTQTGGDAAIANLRTQSYSSNALNQITAISHPGFLEIYGKAPVAQAVTVNGLATTRQGSDFRKELSYTNTTQLWQNVTTSSSTALTAAYYIPAANTAPSYDLDGNQTSDGQWNFTWDAENRLSSATRTAAAIAAGAPYRAISYNYDSMSRKITRNVQTTNGGPITTEKFLYDGWNCIAEYAGTNLKKTNLWGLDLSGTLQGAGGVGGLLSINDVATSTTHYPCYDGNGNARKLLNATNLAATANYDYGPFGELTRATGSYALANSYRFSTKPQDVDTGLVYYNYRPYDTKTGRWIGRDPIEERGGVNLYGMGGNDLITRIDYLGQREQTVDRCVGYLFIGHGSKNGIDFKLNGACAIAGSVSCFPASNAPKDPYENIRGREPFPISPVWPNLPSHDGVLRSGSVGSVVGDKETRDDNIANGRDENDPAGVRNFSVAVKNALDSIPEVVETLCKGCCEDVKIVIDIGKDDMFKNDIMVAIKPYGLNVGRNEKQFKCPKK